MPKHKNEARSSSVITSSNIKNFDRRKYQYIIKIGWFKCKNIKLHEAVINDVVLRVHLTDVIRYGLDSASKSSRTSSQSSKQKNGLYNSIRQEISTPNRRNARRAINIETPRYYLKFYTRHLIHESKLTCSLNELINIIRTILLPVQFKVVVTMNQEHVKSVCITNNQKLEKSITFLAGVPVKIKVDGMVVTLLGCPKYIQTGSDVQILVKILNSISLKDCMVMCV